MADRPASQAADGWGRKVFFLYPPKVILEEMVQSIIQSEYEVYMIQDHVKLVPLLRQFERSVLFVNVDNEVKGLDCAEYVRSLMGSAETAGVQIGVVSFREERELLRKYLVELKVPCGFIRLRAGAEESTKLVLAALKAIHAEDKRRFVRAVCNDGSLAAFNVKYNGSYHAGVIRDISSAGMACVFDARSARFEPSTRFPDIQLKLRGRLCRVTGTVAGRRSSPQDGELYVVLFDKDIDSKTTERLHAFIYGVLQADMDRRIQAVKVPQAQPQAIDIDSLEPPIPS